MNHLKRYKLRSSGFAQTDKKFKINMLILAVNERRWIRPNRLFK